MTTACAPPCLCFPDTALNCPNSSKIYKVRFLSSQCNRQTFSYGDKFSTFFGGGVASVHPQTDGRRALGNLCRQPVCASAMGNADEGKKNNRKNGFFRHQRGTRAFITGTLPFLMRRQQRASDYNNCLLLGVEHLLSRRAGQWAGIIRGLYRYR